MGIYDEPHLGRGAQGQPVMGRTGGNLAARSEVDKTLPFHNLQRVGSLALLGRVRVPHVTFRPRGRFGTRPGAPSTPVQRPVLPKPPAPRPVSLSSLASSRRGTS